MHGGDVVTESAERGTFWGSIRTGRTEGHGASRADRRGPDRGAARAARRARRAGGRGGGSAGRRRPARAQVGGFEIRVVDEKDGAPLAGATVELRSDRGLAAGKPEIADAKGVARFPILRAVGGYSFVVTMPGYQTRTVGPFRVSAETSTVIEVPMIPELRESVSVVARSDLVELEKTAATTRFTDDFIAQLPVEGRFYQDLLTLAPGVNDADDDGNPNVHGSRDRDFQAQVGVVSNADPLTGQRLSWINLDSIETLEILTSGAGVEFGRAQGGFARIIQKQGTNDFSGIFSMIYRSSEIDGAYSPDVPEELQPEFKWEQPSATISGPIVKDRLWFRLSHEYLKNEEPIAALGRVELTTRTQSLHSDQITWQVSPRNKLEFQYLEDPLEIDGFGLDSRVTYEATPTIETGGPTYSVRWSAPYSSKLLVETTAAYQDGSRTVRPSSPTARQDCFTTTTTWRILYTVRCFNVDVNSVTGSYNERSEDSRERITLKSQGTFFAPRFLGASHRVKFGMQIEDERYKRSLERGPTAVFQRDLTPGIESLATVEVTVPVPRASSAKAQGTSYAFYVEDQIKPTASTSFTLGLRLDREEIRARGLAPFDPVAEARYFDALREVLVPTSQAATEAFTAYSNVSEFQQLIARAMGVDLLEISLGPGAIQSQFSVNPQRLRDMAMTNHYLSPRFAAAWDPWRDGKTKIALTAGRYYDKIFLGVPLVEMEPAATELTFPAAANPWLPNSPYFTSGTTDVLDPTISARFVDRDLRAPYQDEFTFSVERLIFPETSLKLSWIRREFRDQLQDVDINHVPGDYGICVRPDFYGDDVIRPSLGAGKLVVDETTGELYTDTDPGPGDGRIDDCTGRVLGQLDDEGNYEAEVPDGRPDLYVQNPGWGDVLIVGNYDSAEYEAISLELARRLYRGWQMNASYTWSMARGSGRTSCRTSATSWCSRTTSTASSPTTSAMWST